MKKLMLKLIAFLISLWVLLMIVIFAFPMYMYNLEYALYKNTKAHMNEPHEVIIIGDSRAQAGILPSEISMDAYSYAVPGGTPVEGYYVLKEYLENNPKPEVVIISFSPYHLELGETFWERAVKYDFLNFKQGFMAVSKSIKLKNDFSILEGDRNRLFFKQYGKYFLYKLKSPSYYISDVSSGFKDGKINYATNASVGRMVNQAKGQYYFGRAEYSDMKNQEAHRKYFSSSSVIEYYLDELFSLCEEYGVKAHYEAPPMNEASAKALNDKFISGYRSYLDDMQHRHSDVDINSGLYSLPNDCFGDQSHLNEKGAKSYSIDLKERLNID